jgi:hypothetical protein
MLSGFTRGSLLVLASAWSVIAPCATAEDGGVTAEPVEAPAETAQNDPLTPIPEDWATAFRALEPDPPPKKLTRNSHYWISDENRHDLFREAIRDKGGVFVGLGTEQNYLMAGWARPDILVPLDFDQMVVSLHYAFRVVFLHAHTPKEFIQMWSKGRSQKTINLIKKTYADEDAAFLNSVLRAYKRGRRYVHTRLRRVLRQYGRMNVPTYLHDPDQYQFVVALFRTNRVFPIRGDLTAGISMKSVAEAAKKAGLPIRILYLSNAEQYFKYTKSYRENMLALPFDDQSVVIRTAGKNVKTAPDGRYQYIVQSGDNFRAWLRNPATFTVWAIVGVSKVNRRTGASTVTRLPPKQVKK